MVGDYSERKKLSASERVPRLDEFQVRLFRDKSLDKDALNREHPVLGFKAGSGAVLSFSASEKNRGRTCLLHWEIDIEISPTISHKGGYMTIGPETPAVLAIGGEGGVGYLSKTAKGEMSLKATPDGRWSGWIRVKFGKPDFDKLGLDNVSMEWEGEFSATTVQSQ
jgi:hypothetical protein